MLAYVEIVHLYLKKNLYSLSRQGEACKDKFDAGNTSRSVSLHKSLTPRSVSNFAKI